ncbi:hypothetical protein OAT67_08380 [Bacteriovoracaceae bacterium]|nr:hypothetical protein [Bacteriovoracaceae bacterium]
MKLISSSIAISVFAYLILGNTVANSVNKNQDKVAVNTDIENALQDSFFDPSFDYSKFQGRVTDRDKSGDIIKISSKNQNIRFFRSGDTLRFRVEGKKTKLCRGYVRSVEKDYFVAYIQDLYTCWKEGEYFRRGTLLNFDSDVLASRVRDANIYRLVLLKRRKSFLGQLNGVNHFVWSYDQERVQVAAEYDQKILEIQKKKQAALEKLLVKKKDSINIQKELVYRLDQLDRDLEFYRIYKFEENLDRWAMDHNLGKPVGKRPTQLKFRD